MAEEHNSPVEKTVWEIRRKTRKNYSTEEEVWIVLEGSRGRDKIAERRRREGIHLNRYHRWAKEFLEAGRQPQVGDSKREADSMAAEITRTAITVRHPRLDMIFPSWRNEFGIGANKPRLNDNPV